MILPDAPWRQRPGLQQLTAVLGDAAGEARFVGGAVRDTLLNLDVADVDIATVHAPDEVMRRLATAAIKAVPTGLAHGTVTAIVDGDPVEVTTLRRDVETDGRHASVAFTDDWREDASRRDFTINAFYADPCSGRIDDYFGGLTDLADRRIRFIGDPEQRIAEDHLRILRFFRFLARFGTEADAAALNACVARANDLMALSRERIAGELLKLLVARNAVSVIALMIERGIFTPVMPEIDADSADRLARLARAEADAVVAADPIRRLAALLPAGAAVTVGARLKLSNAQRKRLVAASAGSAGEDARVLAYRSGRESAIDQLLLDNRDASAILDWTPPRLPLSGGALVARGIDKGPAVNAALKQVEDRWIAEGFPAVPRIDQIADAVAAEVLADISIASAASASSARP